MNKSDTKLLKEYIEFILKEDFGGGDFGGWGDFGGFGDYGGYGMGGMGGGPGSDEGLYKTFIEPFTDVFKTAKAGAMNVSVRSFTLAKILLTALKSSFLPLFKANYDKIWKDNHDRLQEIKNKYSDVFKRTDEALWTGDAPLIAFVLSPETFITSEFIQRAPGQAIELLKILVYGNESLTSYLDKISEKFERLRKETGHAVRDLPDEKGSRSKRYSEPLRQPEEEKPKTKTAWNALVGIIASFVKNPTVKNEFRAGKLAKAISGPVYSIEEKTVKETIHQMHQINQMHSAEDLARFTGSKIPGQWKIAKAKAGDKEKVERMVVERFKQMSKELFLNGLSSKISKIQAKGLPEDHKLSILYTDAIKKISSM